MQQTSIREDVILQFVSRALSDEGFRASLADDPEAAQKSLSLSLTDAELQLLDEFGRLLQQHGPEALEELIMQELQQPGERGG
ncbi:MAG: hypothetical protein WD379_06355 [Dehalococcoidia bacterium]